MFEDKKYVTPTDIAKELELQRQTVINYIKRGDLEAHLFGNRYKITKEQFEKFLKKTMEGEKR